MSENNVDNSNLNFQTRPIEDFIGYNFFVDDYQRGYKWTPRQVTELLEDISEFDPNKESFYCLQPLAVKKREPNEDKIKEIYSPDTTNIFEVIDGQQRLTTIYLILKVIGIPHYSVRYETRPGSADFLETIEIKLSEIDTKLKIDDLWKDFVGRDDNHNTVINNVDNYHFFGAFITIKFWFSNLDEIERAKYLSNLLKNTKFIWYQDITSKDSKKLFRDLNDGKIELTQAELIKALFVNNIKSDNKEILQLKQTEFANEWDMIETGLHDDSFWYFINSSTDKYLYSTRIDFLLEIIENVSFDKDDKQNIYRIYAKRLKENKFLDWKPIKEMFLLLRDWFEDRELYHLIGFMVCRGINSSARKYKTVIKMIVEENKNIGKKKFLTNLKQYIWDELNRKTDKGMLFYDYIVMGYEKKYYDRTVTILLLHNILSYHKSEAKFKFPFDYYKNEKWSLEHIHAQNADDFETVGEIKAWIKDVTTLKEDIQKQKNIENDLTELIDGLENLNAKVKDLAKEEKISQEISGLLKTISSQVKGAFVEDNISNLALLDRNTNSALSNKPYLEKRDKIIAIDKKGWVVIKGEKKKAFIPLCTRNVFLKYYSNKIDQMEFWGYMDRKEYVESIKTVIDNYFKPVENED